MLDVYVVSFVGIVVLFLAGLLFVDQVNYGRNKPRGFFKRLRRPTQTTVGQPDLPEVNGFVKALDQIATAARYGKPRR